MAPIPSKIPHSLRLIIFFLRLAIGLNLFYVGFSVLFAPTLSHELRTRSMNGLYLWIASGAGSPWIQQFAEWAFIVIGACLVFGFLTRLSSIIGLVLTVLSYLPNINTASLNIVQLINDEVIVILCLILLFIANAGTYLGIDTFFHFSLHHSRAKE